MTGNKPGGSTLLVVAREQEAQKVAARERVEAAYKAPVEGSFTAAKQFRELSEAEKAAKEAGVGVGGGVSDWYNSGDREDIPY